MSNDEVITKSRIKNMMVKRNVKIFGLSKKTDINIAVLISVLYFPLHKIKLTQCIRICKALNIKVSDIF